MKSAARHILSLSAVFAFWGAAAPVVSVASPAEPDFYEDVYPFLKANCISCHNKTTTKAELNMETPALMIKGGDSGPSVIPGKSAESLVVEASVHSPEFEMPPPNNKTDARNLNPSEIAILKKWIDLGAKDSVKKQRQVVWQSLEPGVHPIYTLAMTEDGRYAACARSNQISVYDLATQELVTRIVDNSESPAAAHKALVHSVAFSPDGSRFASGGFREVKIWKKADGKTLMRKGDPALGSEVAALTPDGKQIVAADKSGTLIVLNAADGKVISKFAGIAPGGVKLLSVSLDSSKVAIFAAGWNLSVVDLNKGKSLVKRTTPDLVLEKSSKDAAETLAAAVKGLAAAEATVKKANVEKVAATKTVADLKAEIAKASTPELEKQLVDANSKLAAISKSEVVAGAAVKSAETKKVAVEKVAKESAAKLAAARNLPVNALAWTSDGKAVVTGGDDKIVRVWTIPAASGSGFAPAKELKGATAAITAIAGGVDQIVTASKDNKVRVWSVSGAKVLREIPLAGVVGLNLSPDGKLLVTGGSDSAIRIWNVASGKPISELRGSVITSQQLADLEWTVDAKKLEQAFQKTIVTAKAAQDKALDVLLKKAEDAIVAMTKALPVKEKAIKPEQDAVAVEKKKVDEARAVIAKAPEGKADAAMEKALKAALDKLITAETAESSAVAAFAAVQSNITDAKAQVERITASKAENAKSVAAANAAMTTAKTAETKASTDLAALKKSILTPGAKPLAVSFSKDAKKVAAFFSDGKINAWAVATGIPLEQVDATAATVVTLIPKSDGTFTSCNADTSVASTAAAAGWKLERLLGGEVDDSLFADRVNALQFSPDGKSLAVGGGEPSRTGDLALFDVATGKRTKDWRELHQDAVVSVDFSHDGKLLASGAADKIARVTDLVSGKQVNLFEGHTHYVMGVAFRADGRVLATAGADGVVNSWDMILGERKKKIEGWSKEVTSLQFIGATNQIVTSAGDNLIRIVKDDGGQVRSIANLPDFMQVAVSTADGSTIVGGGEDSFLRVWNGVDGKEITAFGTQ